MEANGQRQQRFSQTVAALSETLAVLAGTIAVGLMLMLPLLPKSYQVEVPILKRRDVDATWDSARIAKEVEEAGLGRRARVVLKGGSQRLIVEGVVDAKTVRDPLIALLGDAGYDAGGPDAILTADMEQLLGSAARAAPVMAVQAGAFLAAGLLMIRLRLKLQVAPLRAAPLVAIGWGLAGGGAALVLAIGLGSLQRWLGLPAQEQPWLEEFFRDPANVLAIAPWIVLALPMSEEVFFRGYMFRYLSWKVGLPTGFLVSTITFALVHFNPSGLLIYLAVGVVFTVVYARTSHLLAPIVAHASYNAAVILISTLS